VTIVHIPGCDPVDIAPVDLEALKLIHRHDGRARRGAVTSSNGRLIAGDVADRLVEAGLVVNHSDSFAAGLDVTNLGLRVVYVTETPKR
jgi:hypothetical protein